VSWPSDALSGTTSSLKDFNRLTAPKDVSSRVYIMIRIVNVSPKDMSVTKDAPTKPARVI
jgi:hypothetical protein